MDRHLSPRIAYWTSSFEFETEAVASEVALLRRSFPGSVAWGVSPRDGLRMSWRRGFSVTSRFELPFRMATRVAQRVFHVNHLFGGLGDWSHLRALGATPSVLTVAVKSAPCDASLLEKINQFVIEWPTAREELLQLGIDDERIELIYPPVDLARFRPSPPADGPFTVLFLSSPDRSDWLAARGVDLLLDAASLRPDMRFLLVWRPWGDSAGAVRQAIKSKRLANVEVLVGKFARVERYFQEAHVTAALFRDLTRCKPSPNSIIESLACGRPAIVTRHVGLAPLIESEQVGLIAAEDPDDVAVCLDRLRNDWTNYSRHARLVAERDFSATNFVESYRRAYDSLL